MRRFRMQLLPSLFGSVTKLAFVGKYMARVLAQENCLFSPDVIVVFAHETGPVLHSGAISSLCLSSAKLVQYTPYLELITACTAESFLSKGTVGCIDVNVPSRLWKVKQTDLGNEEEMEELRELFLLLWDCLIAKTGCRKVFFVGSGAPIFAMANLVTKRNVAGIVQGLFFLSSSLYLPMIDNPQVVDWYRRASCVVVPSLTEPRGKVLTGANSVFGTCISAGQYLMADSAAMVSSFKADILTFIRQRCDNN